MGELSGGAGSTEPPPSHEQFEAELPQRVAAAAARFGVTPGERFDPGAGGYVAPVSDDAVLKVAYPHYEAEREPDALALIDGDGSPRLLARADDLWAMLIERLHPGANLWTRGEEEASSIAAEALVRFWRPLPEEHPFRPLAGEAERWVEELPRDWEEAGRPIARALLDEAVALARGLGESIDERYLLHQDFQGSNVLLSERGWLTIDPKPLAGDRAFDLASLLRDRRWELSDRIVRRRFDVLTGATGVDRERARGWGIVHALAWGMDDPGHLLAAQALAEIAP